MKIGIVSPYYIDRFGGVQSHILATRQKLIERGHEVKIIAPKPRMNGENSSEEHIITIGTSAEVKFKSFNTTFPVAMSVSPKEIEDLLNKEKFDVLHVHEPYMLMLPYQIVQKATCPVVGTLHANWPESIINRSLGRAARGYFKLAAAKIDVITAVSPEAGSFARGGVKKPVEVVPNGIDLKVFNPKNAKTHPKIDKQKNTIVYVGRLEKRKGVIYLIRAFAELIKTCEEAELVITGSGPTQKSLKDYVKKHKISNVKFLGHVSEDDKLSLLKSADVYCSPALYGESFGIVLLEAMAMGAPIVAGNNPGYSTVMTDRGQISLINPLNTKEFADRLKLLLTDKELCKLLSAWGQDYVKQFDYSSITDQYEDIYKRVLNA